MLSYSFEKKKFFSLRRYYPHGMTGYLQRKKSQKPREKLQCPLRPEVTHHHSLAIFWSHRAALFRAGEVAQGHHEHPEGWEPSWKSATTSHLC